MLQDVARNVVQDVARNVVQDVARNVVQDVVWSRFSDCDALCSEVIISTGASES